MSKTPEVAYCRRRLCRAGDTNRMLQDGKDLSENSSSATSKEALFFQEKHHFNFLAGTVVSDLKPGASL